MMQIIKKIKNSMIDDYNFPTRLSKSKEYRNEIMNIKEVKLCEGEKERGRSIEEKACCLSVKSRIKMSFVMSSPVEYQRKSDTRIPWRQTIL